MQEEEHGWLPNYRCLVGWLHLLRVLGGSAPELTQEQGSSDLFWTILFCVVQEGCTGEELVWALVQPSKASRRVPSGWWETCRDGVKPVKLPSS